MIGATREIVSRSADDTLDMGRQLAGLLRAGDVVLLIGTIGAGKSVFARGIADGLRVSRWRGSPTFTLINEYQGSPSLYHVDLYRLDENEVRELDLEEYVSPESIVVVEWADRATAFLENLSPRDTWTVALDVWSSGERMIRAERVSRATSSEVAGETL